eukprot:11253254-Karenia_brevis.AAC.1
MFLQWLISLVAEVPAGTFGIPLTGPELVRRAWEHTHRAFQSLGIRDAFALQQSLRTGMSEMQAWTRQDSRYRD